MLNHQKIALLPQKEPVLKQIARHCTVSTLHDTDEAYKKANRMLKSAGLVLL
jgi:hypothetical protein